MKEIILVEGEIDFNILNQNLFNNNSLIITFDFESHKSLNKIPHKTIEEYFSEEDKKEIDDLALNLGTNWYKDKKIIEYQKFYSEDNIKEITMKPNTKLRD